MNARYEVVTRAPCILEASIPFDDTNYRDPEPEPPPPAAPRVSKRDEAILLSIVAIGTVLALVLPISAASLTDIARALGIR